MATTARLSDPLINALEDEWARLLQHPATRRALTDWEREYPILDGIADPTAAPLEQLRAGGDTMLHPLLRIAQTDRDDAQLAGRVILQVMLPAICGLMRGSRGRYAEADEAVEAFWSTIRTYPLHRRQRVTANLYLEAVGLLTRHRSVTEEVSLIDEHDAPPTIESNASEELIDLLAWAIKHEVLDQATAQLLVDRYCPRDADDVMLKHASCAAARAHGLSSAALRKRCSRAVAALQTAVVELGYEPQHSF